MTRALEERKKQLEILKKYFLEDLSQLEISSVKVFGSSTNDIIFDEKNSDIDIIAHTDKLNRKNIEWLLDIIEKAGGNFQDKEPLFIEDFITPRIEYFFQIEGVNFDINIFPNEIWGYDKICNSVLHDALDIFFGGMNLYSIPLHGIFEPLEQIKHEIYPFYSEEIREQRLKIIEKRLFYIIEKIKNKIINGDRDIFEYVLKTRTYFIKWLFIFNRKYPMDLYKHLEFQLKELLFMSDEEIDILMFACGNNTNDIVNNYIELVKEKVRMR